MTIVKWSTGQQAGDATTMTIESEGVHTMASVNIGDWVPEQWDGALVKLYRQTSAVLRATDGPGGRREIMNTNLKHVPKDADADVAFVAKGAAFPVDDEPADKILLEAKKMATDIPLDDEDVKDSRGFTDTVTNKRTAAFSNAALLYDNAALATVGAETTPPTMTRPYTSVYQAAAVTAGNRFTYNTNTGTDADLRAAVKEAVQTAEESAWATDDIVIIASPAWKSYLRDQVQDGSNGVTLWNPDRDTILNYPVYWTRAAVLTTTATYKPVGAGGAAGVAGNKILIAVPRTMLIPGIRETLQWRVTDPNSGVGQLTDTWHLTIKQRVAFALGDGEAAGVAELVSA